MMHDVAFAVAAACTLWAAISVVRSSNLIHAVLWLGAALLGTGLIYAMLSASFLAAVQLLLYVGGVVTLTLFGVMITRKHQGLAVDATSEGSARGFLVALFTFGAMSMGILWTHGLDEGGPAPTPATPAQIGRGLIMEHVLAFELLSMLLLGAIIGAIVIARRREPGERRPVASRRASQLPTAPGTPAGEEPLS